MHRDHKLGLALGVLIVGFAAALCFPKQADIDQRLLQLENTAELDADIAQLPVHAYIDAELPVEKPAPAAPTPEPATEFGPVASVPGSDEFNLLAGPPAPISPAAALDSEPANNNLDHQSPAPVAAAIANTDRSTATEAVPTTGAPHYVVQPGDTLSSVAAAHLGSTSRYLELFEANREILASPDDLQPGMVLVIPGASAGDDLILPEDSPVTEPRIVIPDVAADAPQSEAPVTSASPASGERPRLFRPVRSQPFLKTQPVSRGTSAPLPTMDASESQRNAAESADDTAGVYTVRPGDTLEGIAVGTYGDARRVDDLLKANRETVSNPRRLRPGMKLTLPAAQ
jgi:nucleoid-associated protein YgaU